MTLRHAARSTTAQQACRRHRAARMHAESVCGLVCRRHLHHGVDRRIENPLYDRIERFGHLVMHPDTVTPYRDKSGSPQVRQMPRNRRLRQDRGYRECDTHRLRLPSNARILRRLVGERLENRSSWSITAPCSAGLSHICALTNIRAFIYSPIRILQGAMIWTRSRKGVQQKYGEAALQARSG